MNNLSLEFEKLGFWEDSTEEENIVVYGMDFPVAQAYIIFTDDTGKTPETKQDSLVVACYNDDDCFKWGKELENFYALEQLVSNNPAGSLELLEAIKAYTLPKK